MYVTTKFSCITYLNWVAPTTDKCKLLIQIYCTNKFSCVVYLN